MKRIRQIEESKTMISEALFKLLQQYNLNEITISQITAEAKVGRNTFYRNFKGKNEVVIYSFSRLMNEAKNFLLKIKSPSLKDFLLWRFRIFNNNPHFTVYTKQPEIFALMYEFRKENRDAFKFYFSSKNKLSLEFNMGGLDYVTDHWISKGMKESPEEMVDIVLQLFSK